MPTVLSMPTALGGLLAAADEKPSYDIAFAPPEWVLVVLGFAMVLVFMTLIMTKRLTPMVALILVPTVFGLFAGAGLGLVSQGRWKGQRLGPGCGSGASARNRCSPDSRMYRINSFGCAAVRFRRRTCSPLGR